MTWYTKQLNLIKEGESVQKMTELRHGPKREEHLEVIGYAVP